MKGSKIILDDEQERINYANAFLIERLFSKEVLAEQSVTKLCAKYGINTAVYAYLSGYRPLSIMTYMRLAKAANATLDEVFGLKKNEQPMLNPKNYSPEEKKTASDVFEVLELVMKVLPGVCRTEIENYFKREKEKEAHYQRMFNFNLPEKKEK